MSKIAITEKEADDIVHAIIMASHVLNHDVIGDDYEDADVNIGDGRLMSARSIDDGLLVAVRIIRSKQERLSEAARKLGPDEEPF